MLYIDLYREKHEKIFLSETTRPRVVIFGMKHHLVDLYQVCSNYTHGPKWPHPGGHMLYLGFNREKHEKMFLSETIGPRAMIFDMKHHFVDYSPGAKNGPYPGVTYFTLAYIGKNIKKSPSLKP